MSTPFEVHRPLERAWRREVLFALEVLDGVSLARLSCGLRVTAKGLARSPLVNSRGLFVWLKEGAALPTEIVIEPLRLPYEPARVAGAAIQRPFTQVLLAPRRDYPFAPGDTGVKAMLIETRPPVTVPPTPAVAVAGASAWLEWKDDDNVTWRASPVRGASDERGGVALALRLGANDLPRLDAAGAITARVRADRAGVQRAYDLPFPLPMGRVAEALLPWDEFQ